MTHISQYPSPVWEDCGTPMHALAAPGVDYATRVTVLDDGAGSKGVTAWAFPSGLNRYLHASYQLPHSRKAATNLSPHLHWAPTSADAGNVKLSFEYAYVQIGSELPANSVLLATVFAAPGVAYRHGIASFAPIDGSGISGLSTIMLVTIGRLGADVADTYPEDIYVFGADLHILLDKAGSGTETK